MDNAYMDVYAFFTPHRLVWRHWVNFMGQNDTDAWTQKVEYTVPRIECCKDKTTGTKDGITQYRYGVLKGSVLDYMGVPIDEKGKELIRNPYKINALPVRAYYKIWNDWFRSENITDPVPVDDGDADGICKNEYLSSYAKNDIQYGGGRPLKVARFHDYFSSALPNAQKGNPVTISLGDSAPVIGNGKNLGLMTSYMDISGHRTDFHLGAYTSQAFGGNTVQNFKSLGADTNALDKNIYDSGFTAGGTGTGIKYVGLSDDPNHSGVIADLSSATAITINALREAFAVQKLLEAFARGGTRYTEILKSVFGVTSSDARMQRPEYLGGARISINMDSIVQTSETGNTPQGNVSGYSISGMNSGMFTKSFEEHGTLMVVACIRTERSYQQGLNKMWLKKDTTDYYFPQLANIGELPIFNKELYLQGEGNVNPDTGKEYDDEVFGYQEAWAEYRYKPNEVSGAFRSDYNAPLDAYHYSDVYGEMPTLCDEWLLEGTEIVDRTIAVESALEDQFMCDFFFDSIYSRPMPTYSIPGLIDHH